MARIWVKAGINDKNGKKFDPPLKFRVQGQLTDKETPVLVRADANVVAKIKDASLVKSSPPKYEEPKKKKTK
ncbi:MAG: hypothetical protein GWN94_24890 [Phycisphaerae bacterium]|nr:hypothetical protein [Phycisphaerae bacterium]NIP56333.1 hypothetical protein [Phycisphaerae bacterium]NIS54291.1 hypothetical protein [Phycisphaerae bacterium]NIX29856.1 hypothetical protein [Phycisphaerae bacterium]